MTNTSQTKQARKTPIVQTDVSRTQFCILGTSETKLWGVTCAERLRRAFARNGLTREITPSELENTKDAVIVVRADAVIDTPLLAALISTPDIILTGTDGSENERLAVHSSPGKVRHAAKALDMASTAAKASGYKISSPHDLNIAYWVKLRKREIPYAMAVSAQNLTKVEWRMFMATYKGATDFVTKHIWPVPAFYITRTIAPLGITPNMVTSLSAVFVVLAYLLFQEGEWAWGLASAWAMALLDTVDGKLARVTLTSSKWGNVFDHGIDLIHPPFWYLAWGFGLTASGMPLSPDVLWWTLAIIFAGYLLQRIMEGIAIKFYNLEVHIWRKIDTLFRQITARRNPNTAILMISAIAGRPDLGLIAVAAWTLICLGLHLIQLIQAHREFRRTGTLSSWLTQPMERP